MSRAILNVPPVIAVAVVPNWASTRWGLANGNGQYGPLALRLGLVADVPQVRAADANAGVRDA
jgi:hypothetical protein